MRVLWMGWVLAVFMGVVAVLGWIRLIDLEIQQSAARRCAMPVDAAP